MKIIPARVLLNPIVIIGLVLAGCSTMNPTITEWSHPGYSSASFTRIMIGGGDGQTSIRRNLEDEFVTQLSAAGGDALPSYRYIGENETIDQAKLRQAAQKAGADAAILVRSKVEQKNDYGPNYGPFTSFGIFGRHAGIGWSGPYGAPRVRQYDSYTSEATLYDVGKNEVVWSGTVNKTQPENADPAIKSYVETVIKALNGKNLLGAKK